MFSGRDNNNNNNNSEKLIIRIKLKRTPGEEPEQKMRAIEPLQAEEPDMPEAPEELPVEKFRRALQQVTEDGTWTASPFKPFPYQVRPLLQYLQTRDEGRHAVFALSTGIGKTFMFATICEFTRDRALILVPLKNLLNQTLEEFKKFAPTVTIAKANYKKSLSEQPAQVLITTVQSMHKHYNKHDLRSFDSVIIDEAHECLSAERVKMVKAMKAAGARICAVTATPWLETKRDEKKGGLTDVYTLCDYQSDGSDCPIAAFSIRPAIDEGANAPVMMHAVMPVKMQSIELGTGREIVAAQATRVMDTKECNNIMADVYLNGYDKNNNFNRGKKGLIFCSGIDHAIHVEASFDEAIIASSPQSLETYMQDKQLSKDKATRRLSAELVDPDGRYRRRYADRVAADYLLRTGNELPALHWQRAYDAFRVVKAIYSNSNKRNADKINADKAERILKKFRLGGYLLLAGSDILTEGFDDKEVSVILLSRPSRSWKFITQAIGRGLRPNPADPFKVCMVYQFHMTTEMASYHMIHELISDELNPVFEYGPADLYSLLQDSQPQVRIPIHDMTTYRIVSEPKDGKIYLPPPKKRTVQSSKKRKISEGITRELSDEQRNLVEQMEELDSTLNQVLEFFDQLKGDIIKQVVLNPPNAEAGVAADEPATVNATGKRERAPSEIAPEVKEIITTCKAKVRQIRDVINYSKAPGTAGTFNFKLNLQVSSTQKLNFMQGQLNGLLEKLKMLFKVKSLGLFGDNEESPELEAEYAEITGALSQIFTSLGRTTITEKPMTSKNIKNIKNKSGAKARIDVEVNPVMHLMPEMIKGRRATISHLNHVLACEFHNAYINKHKKSLNLSEITSLKASDISALVTSPLTKLRMSEIKEYLTQYFLNDVKPSMDLQENIIRLLPGATVPMRKAFYHWGKFKDLVTMHEGNVTAIDHLFGQTGAMQGRLLSKLIKRGLKLQDLFATGTPSLLMRLAEAKEDFLFLTMVCQGANINSLHDNEYSLMQNNDEYKAYLHVLVTGNLVLQGIPYLYMLHDLTLRAFERLYKADQLKKQTVLLKGEFEPVWRNVPYSERIFTCLDFTSNATFNRPHDLAYEVKQYLPFLMQTGSCVLNIEECNRFAQGLLMILPKLSSHEFDQLETHLSGFRYLLTENDFPYQLTSAYLEKLLKSASERLLDWKFFFKTDNRQPNVKVKTLFNLLQNLGLSLLNRDQLVTVMVDAFIYLMNHCYSHSIVVEFAKYCQPTEQISITEIARLAMEKISEHMRYIDPAALQHIETSHNTIAHGKNSYKFCTITLDSTDTDNRDAAIVAKVYNIENERLIHLVDPNSGEYHHLYSLDAVKKNLSTLANLPGFNNELDYEHYHHYLDALITYADAFLENGVVSESAQYPIPFAPQPPSARTMQPPRLMPLFALFKPEPTPEELLFGDQIDLDKDFDFNWDFGF